MNVLSLSNDRMRMRFSLRSELSAVFLPFPSLCCLPAGGGRHDLCKSWRLTVSDALLVYSTHTERATYVVNTHTQPLAFHTLICLWLIMHDRWVHLSRQTFKAEHFQDFLWQYIWYMIYNIHTVYVFGYKQRILSWTVIAMVLKPKKWVTDSNSLQTVYYKVWKHSFVHYFMFNYQPKERKKGFAKTY